MNWIWANKVNLCSEPVEGCEDFHWLVIDNDDNKGYIALKDVARKIVQQQSMEMLE